MATNLCKCFICDTLCVAVDKNRGVNIASILTMPLSDVLEKCLRIVTDVQHEYFCIACTQKIEEYDRLMWQSRRIEKELHEHFRNKSFEVVDDQRPIISNGIIFDRDRVNEVLIDMATDGFNDVDVDRKPNIELLHLNEEPTNGNDGETRGESQSNENRRIKTRSHNQQFNSREVSETLKSNEIDDDNSTNEMAKPLGGKRKKKSQNVSCDYCGRTYRSKCALSVHIVKHIDKNPYGTYNSHSTHLWFNKSTFFSFPSLCFLPECKVCQKAFTQRVGLIRHTAIHDGAPLHQVNNNRTVEVEL